MMDWAKLPPLTALRAFSALAERGSAVAAGDSLNVSHAAISQQIKLLEDRLGLALVDRTGRRLTLTAEGQQLADALAAGFGKISHAIELLTGADADRPLQISTTPGFAAHWLMPRMLDFRHQHPTLDVMINPTSESVALEPGGIDIALRYGQGEWPGLASEPLFFSKLVVVAAPGLVRNHVVQCPADLVDMPWVQEYGTSEATDWLRRKGVVKARGGGMIQVPGNFLLDAVRQGQGVCLTVRRWVEEDVAAGNLVLLFEEPEVTGYHIVTRPGVLRPKARIFSIWLKRQAKIDFGEK